MFPLKPEVERSQRKKGGRKRQVAFRAPDDLNAYFEAAIDNGYTLTEVLLKLIRSAKGAADELGDDWVEVERLAAQEQTTHGQMLGRLARIGLLQHRKPKK